MECGDEVVTGCGNINKKPGEKPGLKRGQVTP
jgi:hypothetical protein